MMVSLADSINSLKFTKPALSGEYLAVVSDANGSVLEIPGSPVSGDSDGNRGSRVLAVGYSQAELP